MSLLHLDIRPTRLPHFTAGRRWSLALLIGAMLLITTTHLIMLPHFGGERIHLVSLGFELLNWCTLAFMFWVVQCARLQRLAYLLLSTGIGIWLLGATFDLLDEVVAQPLWIAIFAEDMLRSIGMLLSALGILHTMSYVGEIHTRLNDQAHCDELTGLPNRRSFAERLGETRQALLLLDLDHFKGINDRFGHASGDQVLRRFGTLLREACPTGALAARIGGEEFVLLLPAGERADLLALAERLRLSTQAIVLDDGTPLTVSLGVGLQGKDETLEQLFRRADTALYRAKMAGRDRSEWAD
ncbi:GGDEF domain-containing protein [Aeromonas schubertii]|uniref:GGDEF domain-containing protein n=1 Tax=Aeromonas schubertii TaxID=652 RepID=UPI001CC5E3B1|nr:GGDEF domain-containing protein [Aeromonas schubertii]MBZ6073478.1 GGDEF domain-containing protein [Aeromonas schubertii]